MQNDPVRHHYVPQFYLRGWTSHPEGKLWRYLRTPAGTLHEKPVAPKGTAFENDLYTLSEATLLIPQGDPSSIETEFFRKIDNDGATVLEKLTTSGPGALSENERTAWALFLNSLLERSPARLAPMDARAKAIVDQSYERMQEGSDAEDQARFSRIMNERARTGMARNQVRHHMTERIQHADVIACLKRANWRVINVHGGFEFITTDAPVTINLGEPGTLFETLAIALTPEKLFLMHPHDWKDDADGLQTLGLIATVHNLILLQRPCTYVYSRSKIADGEMIRLRRAVELTLGKSADEITGQIDGEPI